jgi:hypothetical protein
MTFRQDGPERALSATGADHEEECGDVLEVEEAWMDGRT